MSAFNEETAYQSFLEEKAALLEKYYKQCGLPIDVFIKEGADHHPHGLENPCIVADIIEKF
jgi:hypothetical protein